MQNTMALRRDKVAGKGGFWDKVKSFDVVWFVLRLALGYVMLDGGIEELTKEGGWTASGFLSHGTGPFASTFAHLAGNGVVDGLVIWGEILIGAALPLGVAVRLAAFWGAVMMLLFYLPNLPPANGWISQQFVYMLVFIALIFSGTGYFLGIDRLAKRFEKKVPALKYILG